MFTHEGDAGIHRHVQRRGSVPCVQRNDRVHVPRGECQPQCRPVHRGQSAHTQRMDDVASGYISLNCTTDRSLPSSSKFECPESRGTQDNAERLRHVEPVRVSLRHASPSPSQLSNTLNWLAKKQSRRPLLDFLFGHAYQDGGCKSIEVTSRRRRILFAAFVARMEDTSLPKCVIFGKLVEGAGCVGGVGERADGVFRQRPMSFRHQRRPVDHYSPGRGGMAQDSRIRGGTFHGEMNRCRESQD